MTSLAAVGYLFFWFTSVHDSIHVLGKAHMGSTIEMVFWTEIVYLDCQT